MLLTIATVTARTPEDSELSGFIRFMADDWSSSSSMTRLVFDLLVDRLPEGQTRSDIAELRDDNVLMLDLREPTQDLLVETIVNHLPVYVETLDADVRSALLPGFTRLLELATDQHRRNQATQR